MVDLKKERKPVMTFLVEKVDIGCWPLFFVSEDMYLNIFNVKAGSFQFFVKMYFCFLGIGII